ncbi:hypothetical protein [uncultured Pontibacter sp.]|uniref:hypothetical protein n=1 Tax=uncultured Pontibacter sp. TaxID=453356 RepID=UPI0026186948|nr:hypothetical protein [uncultured Pontibacter sp.]
MKRTFIVLGLVASSILTYSCENNSEKGEAKEIQIERQSLWTDSLKSEFVEKNASTDYEKFIIDKLIEDNKFEKGPELIQEELKKESFATYKNINSMSYLVEVDKLAGKSKAQIEIILGQPNKKEKVNPSSAPCPCDKYIYLDNLVEIVYIKNKADWITINNAPFFVKVKDSGSYRSVDRFDDYTYVKVKTR